MESWVHVRVTDMRGIDLNVYRFNYDLTMAILLMHPDGTIYSTYAGRDFTDASSHQSAASLARVLDSALDVHAEYSSNPRPPRRRKKKKTVEREPWWRDNEKAQKQECFHCHQVHDGRQHDGRRRGKWTERDQYTWPDPFQVGLRLDRDDQVLVTEAPAGSKIRKGDRIVSLGKTRTLSFGDIQRALHHAPWGRGSIPVRLLRDGKEIETAIPLRTGWKKPTPEIYAWRPMKWPMSPMPGFGGSPLTAAEKKTLSLPTDSFAFRVGYIVTWGSNAKTGRNAHRAGIRKGTVVYEVGGKSDFLDMHHFHAWFRMTQKPGRAVKLKVIQNGTRESLSLEPLP